ncbi:chorismate synthase, partial [Burkholderia gladioli]|nr:chorismate synthase [Burkholderia gladioli]
MSGNTLGKLFTVTTFGESHGPAIGCVIDGCPPGMELTEADIQLELDRRKPGTSRHVTQRQEPDAVEILSGVFEGRTTGTPIDAVVLLAGCDKTTAMLTRNLASMDVEEAI